MINYGKICGLLCAIALLAMLNPGGAHADEPPVTVEQPPQKEKHYQLKRRVIRVALDSNPLVRVQCTLRDVQGISETMVWDPAARRGLTRYALLPKQPQNETCDVLECVSDRLDLQEAGASFAYVLRSQKNCQDPASPGGPTLAVEGEWKSMTGGKDDKTGGTDDTIKLKVQAWDVTKESAEEKAMDVKSSAEKQAAKVVESVLEQLGGFEYTTNLRSLDPATSLVTDLLGTLATIALDRASEAGKQYVRSFLQDHLCESLTVRALKKDLKDSLLTEQLQALGWPDERRLLQTTCTLIDTARIDELASARDAVWRAVAVDATILASAILEGSIQKISQLDPGAPGVREALVKIVRLAGDLMRVTIAGNTATTERDVQVLILALGRVGLDKGTPGGWRCGLEAGIAVLRDCLRDQSCSADELQRLLEQERRLSENDNDCKVGAAIEDWPELPTLLGRIADVLRPAPGVDASLTAATAFELVLDVVEHVLKDFAKNSSKILVQEEDDIARASAADECKEDGQKCNELLNKYNSLLSRYSDLINEEAVRTQYISLNKKVKEGKMARDELLKEYAELMGEHQAQLRKDEDLLLPFSPRYAYTLAMIRTLRAVVAVVRGEDPAPAIVELAAVLNKAITGHCQDKCDVLVTTTNLRRAFAVVSALASYGASYRGNGSGEDAPEDLQKQRAEERRKALETVIDAFTDRSQRKNDEVWSVGANVALGYQHRFNFLNDSAKTHQLNLNLVSLPMGLAFQQLPGDDHANFHVMVTFIDLAQYLTLSRERIDKTDMGMEDVESKNNIQAPKPELATALRLGLEAGLLFGEPSFPLSVTVHGAWIPRATYEGDEGRDEIRSEFRFGASVGVYVPFLDLN